MDSKLDTQKKRCGNPAWGNKGEGSGKCGNGGIGRPKKDQSVIELIRKKLKDVCPYDAKQRTWLEALADAEMAQALNETPARRDLLDRLCGRPVESIEHGGSTNLVVRVIYDND